VRDERLDVWSPWHGAQQSRASLSFQDDAFVLLGFATAAMGFARLPRIFGLARGAWSHAAWVAAFGVTIAAAEFAARAALTSPDGYTRSRLVLQRPAHLVQSNAEWAHRLRHAVAPNEPILALPTMPGIYIGAGRLPMPGINYYLPWDADYARQPWFGRGRDICAALRRAPPPVIYDTNWVVWGLYAPKDYMPCVDALLTLAYTRENAASDFYIRNDRLPAWRAAP
jgi:hypothetical protein